MPRIIFADPYVAPSRDEIVAACGGSLEWWTAAEMAGRLGLPPSSHVRLGMTMSRYGFDSVKLKVAGSPRVLWLVTKQPATKWTGTDAIRTHRIANGVAGGACYRKGPAT